MKHIPRRRFKQGDSNRASRCCRVAILRGRKAVRADRRLGTDEKAIRAQSTISHKNPAPALFLTLPEFSERMLLIRTENPVGARSAQIRPWHATVCKTPYMVPA